LITLITPLMLSAIMVTADHSHVFTISGYPARGNPILGLVRNPDPEAGGPAKDYAKDLDDKPYTTLGYANGPNTAVRLESETHAGEDVPLYATGPSSHLVRGVMEQNEISDIIDAALGLK